MKNTTKRTSPSRRTETETPGFFANLQESFKRWANIDSYFGRASEKPPVDKKRNVRPGRG